MGVLLVGIGTVAVVSAITAGLVGPAVCRPAALRLAEAPGVRTDNRVTVMTLNLAHGRGNGRNQCLQSGRRIRGTLGVVAELLRREQPDVVALQEADGESVWSGDFDHVTTLGRDAGFFTGCRAENVRGLGLSYGTALLSQFALADPAAHTFAASPPTFSKGFVVAGIRHPASARPIDIVSVHLDFSRSSVRRRQVDHMIRVLRDRGRPLVVMGDFNCEWGPGTTPVTRLAAALGLRAYRPEDDGMATFPTMDRRLDWILVSPELRFLSCRTLPDVVSDHLPIVAELELTPRVVDSRRATELAMEKLTPHG